MKRIFLFFLFLIVFNNSVFALDEFTNSIFSFDYSKPNSNDCWDVNYIANGDKWINTPIGEEADKLSKEALCRKLVFYYSSSDKNQTDCGPSNSDDPVCIYYRNLYHKKNDKLRQSLLTIGVTEEAYNEKYRAVRACQWLSTEGYCVPKHNVPLASNYLIPNRFPDNKTIAVNKIVNVDSYSDSVDDDYKFISNFHKMIIKNDKFLADNRNLASALGLIRTEKLEDIYWLPELSSYIRDKDNNLTLKEQNSCTGIPEKAERVIELQSIPCEKFDSTDPDIIALLSNKYSFQSIKSSVSSCKIKVVVVRKIERKQDTCKIDRISPTFQNTMFVYNDDYLAFISVTSRSNGERYEISSERPKTERRYDGICEEINSGKYNLDINKIAVAKAVIGFNPGYSKAIDALQLISKGDLSIVSGQNNTRYPQSLKKLLSIKLYCPLSFGNNTAIDTNFEKFTYNYLQSIDSISATNKTGGIEKYLGDDNTTLGPVDRFFSNSQFNKIFSDVLNNRSDLPKAYIDEIKGMLGVSSKKNLKIGGISFYSALAESAGFTSMIRTGTLDDQNEKWAISSFLAENKYISPKFYELFLSNAFAQTPITGANNVHYYIQNSTSPEYNQLGTVSSVSANYLYGLDVLSDAVSNPIYVLNPSVSADGTGSGSKGKSSFARWLGSDGASKLGMLALSYWMTSEQQKLDSERIKSQLELEMIKSRMNQCSSLDCTIQQELCLMQKVKCRTDRKILGIKIGRKDDMCYKKDLPKDSDEAKDCYTCSDTLTATQTYLNPYTGESKLMTLYEICLMNVTNSLLNKNKCFDLIEINTRTPGLLSDSDIRNCFLGLTPTKNTTGINYIPASIAPKSADAKTEEKKAEEKKAAAAGTGGGSGSAGSASSPGSSVKEKESPKMNDMNFGRYNQNNENYQRYPGGTAGYGTTGSYNANSGTTVDTGSGLKTMKPVTSDGLTIINLIDGQQKITGDKTK